MNKINTYTYLLIKLTIESGQKNYQDFFRKQQTETTS